MGRQGAGGGARQDGAATVDVWTVAPAVRTAPHHLDLLDRHERRRAGDMAPAAAARFVLGRTLLRTVLGQHLGRPPAEVTLDARCPFCGGGHGPVRLVVAEPAAPPWQLSVTRAGPLVGVALSSAGAVGIDIESVDAVAAASLSDVALSPAERARHRDRPPVAAARYLAHTWARKEAVLKALGVGLRHDPAGLELTADGAAVLGRDDVAVADLDLGPGRVGSVALVVPEPTAGPLAPPAVRLHDGAAVLAALG